VLYSCKVKLFPWIPEFIVNFLTKKALTESTGWVKRVSEKEQELLRIEENKKKLANNPFPQMKFEFDKSKLPSWMNKIQGGFSLISSSAAVASAATNNQEIKDNDSTTKDNKLNHFRDSIIKNSFRLAPFMRMNGRGCGGKLC
jgi:hypothetical protein